MYGQFSHKLKWKQLTGSLVNKYKLDLLWLMPCSRKTFAILPVDAIRYRKYARLLQKGHWAQILWLFYHLFVKMPIDAVFSYVQF
jgi:hypothetical protein